MRFIVALGVLFVALAVPSYAATRPLCSSSVDAQTQTRVVTAENDLGFALLRRSSKNAFISPFSIGQALGVVYLGARGDTVKAFVSASVVPPIDPTGVACASQNLRADLPAADPGVTLDFANALWVRRGLTLKTAFVGSASEAFGADVKSLDFASPDALRTINAWVSERTKGHIPTILSRLGAAQAIVTNAVYFKGLWERTFAKSQTSPARFFGAAGPTTVPFMKQTETIPYYADAGFQMVRLGYRGDRFAMYVVLPATGTGLAMASALGSAFAKALAHAAPRQVYLHLPKLHLNYEANLVAHLTNLGLGVAFSDRADFSGISDRPLQITSVVHKTTLDVDEAGTTATAATAVVMEATARYNPEVPVVVNVDHPFFCIVRDDRSGAVLFLGAISDVGAAGVAASPATAVLKKFYQWYSVQPNHDWTPHFSQVKSLFDRGLYAALLAVLRSEANQKEPIIDFDPFVNAQFDAQSYEFGTPSTKGGDVLVPVTLNRSVRTAPKSTLTAVLRKNAAGSYVIYNLIYDPKFNLRDYLQKQLKK
jgi:serine protease inhibitor